MSGQFAQRVGWVERSDTHRLKFAKDDGFREGLNPSYELTDLCPLFPDKIAQGSEMTRCANNGSRLFHSITSSALASRLAGIVRPSALAVLRLITSPYLVGACTGRSAGLAPFRSRSTYEAACL
jgi:hypothetical protein